MVKIDKDKVQMKYVLGLSRCAPHYPSYLDVLYESCMESADDNLFSDAKIQNRYELDENGVGDIISKLLGEGYIVKNNSRYKIVKTPWD